MMHGQDISGPDLVPPKWCHERKKPKGKEAAVGRMGTIGQCLPGDLVACESLDGKRVIWLTIAWQWPDGKAAMVRIYNFRTRQIDLTAPYLRNVRAEQRVRWLGVRPK